MGHEIKETVEAYIKAYDIPGAVVLVGHGHGDSFHEAYGAMDGVRPLSKDAIYDVASITKVFTATALLKAMEGRGLSVEEPLSKALPEYERAPTADLKFESLLRHESGFPAVAPEEVFAASARQSWKRILALNPSRPGGEYLYSDVNYMVLGKALEALAGVPLDQAVEELLLVPLGMESSSFRPRRSLGSGCKNCVPTSQDSHSGIVHDPAARKLNGLAGHAGLFASAKDLSKFASLFLNEGRYCGRPVISRRQTLAMTVKDGESARGLGFDISSPYSEKPRGDYFAKGLSFGHTGYTGVSLWIDPSIDTYLIVLSNPVYAKDWKKAKKGFLRMAGDLANIVGRAYTL